LAITAAIRSESAEEIDVSDGLPPLCLTNVPGDLKLIGTVGQFSAIAAYEKLGIICQQKRQN
jgi:hypothetical protein